MRLASANTFDSTVSTLTSRQSALSAQQDRVSAGLRVVKASDDPISAASAERALSRITQLQADQRALNVQRNALANAESTLGQAGDLMQRFRELTISAGSGSKNATDRTTIANEMTTIREQLFSLANTRDSNGVYLFSGLEIDQVQGVMTPAFTTTGAAPNLGYDFNGTSGQNLPTQNAVPFTMDGNDVFMQVPKGNGVYDITLGATNTGQISTDIGQYSSTVPGAASNNYQITFSGTGSATTYNVVDTTAAPPTSVATGTYTSDQPITFSNAIIAPALASTQTLTVTVSGTPGSGDTVNIAPYTAANPANTSLFALMDDAINGITATSSSNAGLSQAISQALTHIDSGMTKLLAARGQAGIWLNRADTITSSNESRSMQLETDRSNAQDLDMVTGISDMEKIKTGYQVALQSYAQIQKLSLFDYIR
jgi:flagellar hook-associated protein 3 FlgL